MTPETKSVLFPFVLSAIAVFVGVLIAVAAVQITVEISVLQRATRANAAAPALEPFDPRSWKE